MRRFPPFLALGLAVAGLMALSIGARPALRAQAADPAVASAAIGGAFGGAAQDELPEVTPFVHVASPPMSLAATRVWLKLQEKVAFNFPDETPLEDILKYIKKATEEKAIFPNGIPIYVDPQGLQDADKTLASPASIDLDGIPLATTLRLVLGQLKLGYKIHEDGMVFITSIEANAESDANLRIMDTLSELRDEVHALREEVRGRRHPAGLPEEGRANRSPGGRGGGMRNSGGMM